MVFGLKSRTLVSEHLYSLCIMQPYILDDMKKRYGHQQWERMLPLLLYISTNTGGMG